MSFLVKDILKLKNTKEIKLLGGYKGLGKCIEWVHVLECFENPSEGVKWLQGGEIVIITGIKNDAGTLVKLVEGISERKGAALILNIEKYIGEIPNEVIEIADKLEIPLFTLPWKGKIMEISKEISNAVILSRIEEKFMKSFFYDVLFGKSELEINIKEKAKYLGYNLKGKCCICIIQVDGFEKYAKLRNLNSEVEIYIIKFTFRKLVQDVLERHLLKVPIIYNNDEIIFLNRAEEDSMDRLNRALKEIRELIINNMNEVVVNVGIGNSYEDLKLMKDSFNEAQIVIQSLKLEGADKIIRKYSDMGVYSLIFNIKNKNILENYCKQIIGPIIENTMISKDVSDVAILDMYLSENCNLTLTAEKLYLHRNTLTYHIKNIEKLLNCNLHSFEDCFRIRMALYISKIL